MLSQQVGVPSLSGRFSSRTITTSRKTIVTSASLLPAQPTQTALPGASAYANQVVGIRFATARRQATIPVVDMQDFLSGDAKRIARFVRKLGNALRDTGFVALSNHGIPLNLLNEHYTAMGNLFSKLPRQELDTFAFNQKHGIERGYYPPGKERKQHILANGDKKYILDSKETWETGHKYNVYPLGMENFARLNQEMFHRMQSLGMTLVDALAQYLGDETGYLKGLVTDENGNCHPDNIMRSAHYLPYNQVDFEQEKIDSNHVLRAGEHKDLSLFTLLPQSTDRGLQLLQRDGKTWKNIDAQQGMIIMNSGDLLELITKGLKSKDGKEDSREIVSTRHRVIGDKDSVTRDRYSTPFFFQTNLSKPVYTIATGSVAHFVDPKRDIDVHLDSGSKLFHARLVKNGTIPADMSYDDYVRNQQQLPYTMIKALAVGPNALLWPRYQPNE